MSKDQNLCSRLYCTNKKYRSGNLCSKHRKRKYRQENKLKAAYQNLRTNAKRRGKEFSITLEEFEKFCIKTEYIKRKGRSKDSYSIDRINDEKGYTIDNITILSISKNIKKELRKRKFLKEIGQGEFRFLDECKKNNEDVPF